MQQSGQLNRMIINVCARERVCVREIAVCFKRSQR
jgi:hypothetical protein